MKIFLAVLLTFVAAAQGGVVRSDVDSRILGGSGASAEQFPWNVHISMDGRAFCGGAVISLNWVLTAAHCVKGYNDLDLTFGSVLPGDSEGGAGVQKRQTRDHFHYIYYNDQTITDNIGLVTFVPQLIEMPTVKAVPLPSYSQTGESFAGQVATVSGWGKTTFDATSYAETLQWVDLPVISNSLCNASYHSITTGNICASGLNGRSTCSGDSGSPLVLRAGSSGTAPLIGILSYDYLVNCQRDYPAVFTRVTHYLSWIDENTDLDIDP